MMPYLGNSREFSFMSLYQDQFVCLAFAWYEIYKFGCIILTWCQSIRTHIAWENSYKLETVINQAGVWNIIYKSATLVMRYYVKLRQRIMARGWGFFNELTSFDTLNPWWYDKSFLVSWYTSGMQKSGKLLYFLTLPHTNLSFPRCIHCFRGVVYVGNQSLVVCHNHQRKCALLRN